MVHLAPGFKLLISSVNAGHIALRYSDERNLLPNNAEKIKYIFLQDAFLIAPVFGEALRKFIYLQVAVLGGARPGRYCSQ